MQTYPDKLGETGLGLELIVYSLTLTAQDLNNETSLTTALNNCETNQAVHKSLAAGRDAIPRAKVMEKRAEFQLGLESDQGPPENLLEKERTQKELLMQQERQDCAEI